MSRYQAFARAASLAAMMVVATVGVATLTPGSASATPGGSATARVAYPPPPPNMVVNKGTVKAGVTVKATGRNYKGKEKVYVTVTFTPKGSHKSKVVKAAILKADSKGKMIVTVKMSAPGTAVITGKGLTSKKSASATVHVINKHKGHGGWVIVPASFSTGATAGTPVLVSSESGPAGIALVGLGALALLGSAAVTRQTIRRRRVGAAA
jgi:hypothetical protein